MNSFPTHCFVSFFKIIYLLPILFNSSNSICAIDFDGVGKFSGKALVF